MPKRPTKDHDPNSSVARVIRQTTAMTDELPADAEAAWAAWSKSIQKCDARTMTLLRAAFEAGVAAGRR